MMVFSTANEPGADDPPSYLFSGLEKRADGEGVYDGEGKPRAEPRLP